jgi:hypothetical protein
MVACAMNGNGKYIWASKNYDGDVQSEYCSPRIWFIRTYDKCINDT